MSLADRLCLTQCLPCWLVGSSELGQQAGLMSLHLCPLGMCETLGKVFPASVYPTRAQNPWGGLCKYVLLGDSWSLLAGGGVPGLRHYPPKGSSICPALP